MPQTAHPPIRDLTAADFDAAADGRTGVVGAYDLAAALDRAG